MSHPGRPPIRHRMPVEPPGNPLGSACCQCHSPPGEALRSSAGGNPQQSARQSPCMLIANIAHKNCSYGKAMSCLNIKIHYMIQVFMSTIIINTDMY